MLTIEYAPHGTHFSSFEVEEAARLHCDMYNRNEGDMTCAISSDEFVTAMKLMVIEGHINHKELQFKFKDELLFIDKTGNISRYPKGFCDTEQGMLYRIVKKRLNIYREERDRNASEHHTG